LEDNLIHSLVKKLPQLLSHRITECSGLAGPSVGHPAQPPAQAGSPTAGCTAPRPGGSWSPPLAEICVSGL